VLRATPTTAPGAAEAQRARVSQALSIYLAQLGPFAKLMQQYRSLRAAAGVAETADTRAAFAEADAALRKYTPVAVRVPANERTAAEVAALERAKRVRNRSRFDSAFSFFFLYSYRPRCGFVAPPLPPLYCPLEPFVVHL
jgi:hypothetical protein